MPISLLGMLLLTTSQQRFTCVGHILQPQLPTAARLAVATSPHGSVARLSGGGYSVPSASHPGVTPDARPGRVPMAEHRIFMFPDQYTCDLVSHVRGRCRGRTDFRSGGGVCFPEPAEKICKGIRHAVQPFVGGVGLGGRFVESRSDRRAAAAKMSLSAVLESLRQRMHPQVSRKDTRHSGRPWRNTPSSPPRGCIRWHSNAVTRVGPANSGRI